MFEGNDMGKPLLQDWFSIEEPKKERSGTEPKSEHYMTIFYPAETEYATFQREGSCRIVVGNMATEMLDGQRRSDKQIRQRIQDMRENENESA